MKLFKDEHGKKSKYNVSYIFIGQYGMAYLSIWCPVVEMEMNLGVSNSNKDQ